MVIWGIREDQVKGIKDFEMCDRDDDIILHTSGHNFYRHNKSFESNWKWLILEDFEKVVLLKTRYVSPKSIDQVVVKRWWCNYLPGMNEWRIMSSFFGFISPQTSDYEWNTSRNPHLRDQRES